jgi:hypothetical protein
MTAIGSTGSILTSGAAELGRSNQSDITRFITHVSPEDGV